MRRSTEKALRGGSGSRAVAALAVVGRRLRRWRRGGDDRRPRPTTEARQRPRPPRRPRLPATTEAPPASGLGSEFDVASAGDVTLKLWWLGDLEAPGDRGVDGSDGRRVRGEVPERQRRDDARTTRARGCRPSRPRASRRAARTSGTTGAAPGRSSPPGRAARSRTRTVLAPADIEANPRVQETLWQGKTWDYPALQVRLPDRRQPRPVREGGPRRRAPRPRPGTSGWRRSRRSRAPGSRRSRSGLKDGFGGEIAAAGQLEKQCGQRPGRHQAARHRR